MAYISLQAIIEKGAFIGRNVSVLAGVRVSAGAIIEDNCIVGKPSRIQIGAFRKRLKETSQLSSYEDYDDVVDTPTIIAADVYLQSGTVIYSGCTLKTGVTCEDNCVVRWDTTIGENTNLMLGVV